MADASAALCVGRVVSVKKTPDNLYEVCLTNLVNYLQKCKCERNDLRSLPDSILMDVYYKVSAMCPSYLQKLNKNSPLVGECCSRWSSIEGWDTDKKTVIGKIMFSYRVTVM